MDESFSQSLAEWTAFYSLMGGAGATLLGLLFVAVSLRLNIFHQRNVADVRYFAALTLGMFLAAIAIAGLALVPHESRNSLAIALFAFGVAGLLASVGLIRLWVRLNLPVAAAPPGYTPYEWEGWAFMVGLGGGCAGLIVDALLVWNAHPHALGWLGLIEGWLLGMGTVAAWIMLSHAGRSAEATTDSA